MKTFIDIFKRAMMGAFFASAIVACTDDIDYPKGQDSIEGVATELTLRVDLNAMKSVSRTAPKDEYANEVNDLWVGIYSANNGELKFSKTFSKAEIGNPDGSHQPVTLPKIETKSGNSYIVAVANVGSNYGISDDSQLTTALNIPAGRGALLKNLLESADTWEKYKSISHMLTTPSNVDFSENNALAMSGSYHDNSDVTNHPDSWFDADGNPAPVDIKPGESKLPGYIHLRRLISYVKFNIVSAANIKAEPVSWTVHNIPVISYLQERNSNAADVSTYFQGRTEGEDLDEYKLNHGNSNVSYDFGSGKLTNALGEAITVSGQSEGASFDFYQMENKQTAIAYSALGEGDYVGISKTGDGAYQEREREWKAADGSNTGVYKSLCASSALPVPGDETSAVNTKNFASYVTVRMKVTYWVNQNAAAPGTEGAGDIVSPETEGATRREAYVDYTVHLGYIEGDNKAEDFNCRRNTKYTYNMIVNGVNNIILEARNESENQPGSEGNVSDINENGYVELDAHYCVFNIKLTNAERSRLNWMIEAPYDGKVQSLYSGDFREAGESYASASKQAELAANQFYSWIKFKPTRSETQLRLYHDGGNNNPIWTLEQLADPANYPGVNSNGNAVTSVNSTQELWYTVFIDEYVYHKNLEGQSTYTADGKEGSWWAYVNQEPRKIWLACNNPQTSSDKESFYVDSKYLFSQNSLLTYYSAVNKTSNNTALAMERENETFGLNLAWSTTAYNNAARNADNGRYNVWYYLTNNNISSTTSASGRGWFGVVMDRQSVRINGSTYYVVNAFSRDLIDNGQYKETELKKAHVYMPKAISGDIYLNGGGKESARTNRTYDPQPDNSNRYEVLTACMSRNRDENGDGVIDASEMKWYVPTTGKYSRIILGRAVIPQSQRLMNFDLLPTYGFWDGTNIASGNSDNNTRFHFASSDIKTVWAEEGTSTADWYQGDWDMGGWEIRCVRNLGVNMGQVLSADPVTPAYEEPDGNNIFSLTYYEDGCKRAASATYLPPHDVQSSTNQPAAQFEVASSICTSSNTTIPNTYGISINANGVISGYSELNWYNACQANAVCGNYTQTGSSANRGVWRVPNQKELVMMRREGFLDYTTTGNATSNDSQLFLSCTQEHYDKSNPTAEGYQRRFFVFYRNRGTINPTGNKYVRCVRDILTN